MELNINADERLVDRIASEAAGSPQLMQSLCLNCCLEAGARERAEDTVMILDDRDFFARVCARTALTADFSAALDRMKEGPKQRGRVRKVFKTKDGGQGDVYELLPAAIATDPPQLTLRYNDLVERIAGLCDGPSPSGSSITSACEHVARLVNSTQKGPVVEWDSDSDVFDIRDPYFLFYLRWSSAV
jgi:hypothetical protein